MKFRLWKNGIPMTLSEDALEVLPEGMGTFTAQPGHSGVVYIEDKTLYVWADINQEDYTHKIDLSDALESNRQEADPIISEWRVEKARDGHLRILTGKCKAHIWGCCIATVEPFKNTEKEHPVDTERIMSEIEALLKTRSTK